MRSEEYTIDIKYFDPRQINPASVILLIGKRGSGKSTVAEDLMSYFTFLKEGVCVSKTDKMNGFWSEHIPKLFIHHKYSESITQRLLAHQEKKWLKHKKECKALGVKPEISNIEPCFAIFDDVTYDKRFLRDNATRELFMNGRHYKILVVITCQYLMDMGPDLRNQIDYVFILKDNIRNNRAKMYEYFAGMFPSFVAFQKTFVECTNDREALVLHNSSLSNNVSDCVFFYKARPNRKYKLGSPKYWGFGNSDTLEDDNEDAADLANANAGLSKSEREKSENLSIRKFYPGDLNGFSDKTEYVSPSLLANPSIIETPRARLELQTLQSHPPPTSVQPVDLLDSHLPEPPLKPRREKKTKMKPLQTYVDSYYPPCEPFGEDILRQIDDRNKPRNPRGRRRKLKQRKPKRVHVFVESTQRAPNDILFY